MPTRPTPPAGTDAEAATETPAPGPEATPDGALDGGSPTDPEQADTTEVPANRAARRGRGKGDAAGGGRFGSDGRPRAAQGRRFNPVRRTG